MASTIELEDKDLKSSLLGLAVALIEIIKDTLKVEAIRRMEKGRLSNEEVERLGRALMNLEKAVEEIKEEHAIKEAVKNVREGLDSIVENAFENIMDEEKLIQQIGESGDA